MLSLDLTYELQKILHEEFNLELSIDKVSELGSTLITISEQLIQMNIKTRKENEYGEQTNAS